MQSPDALRDRFAAGSLQTASGPKVVTMCFDRLDRELEAARTAIEESDHFETNRALGHAQDLIAEMAAMLDLQAWEHAGALVALYDYLLRLLAAANATKHAAGVGEAQAIVRELGAAFRAAADAPPPAPSAADPFASDVPEAATGRPDRPHLSVRA